jgi:hypothetical protein
MVAAKVGVTSQVMTSPAMARETLFPALPDVLESLLP